MNINKPKIKRGSCIEKVYNLSQLENKNLAEIAEITHLSLGKIAWCLRKIQERMPSEPQSCQTQELVKSNPSSSNYIDMSCFIPHQDGYIARRLKDGKTDIDVLELAYNSNPKDFVLLEGETGTGKTHLVRHFAYTKKLPYARINLNGGTTADELVGHFVPDEKGGFKWQDGLLTLFARNGGVLVLDEVNACPAEILFALHSITDDERSLTLVDKDSEVIHSHPNFFLVCTMNPDYEGTKPLNKAFRSRFKIKLYFDYDEKVEKKLVESEEILKLASKLRVMKAKGEIVTPISTRDLIYFEDNSRKFGKELALDFFLNNFEIYERDPIRNVLELLSSNIDDSSKRGD